MVHSEKKLDETKVKQSKKLTEKLLSHVITINDLSDVTQSETLDDSEVKTEQHNTALGCVDKRV